MSYGNKEKLQLENSYYFKHHVGDYTLEGRILYNSGHQKPWVLSIHGARSDYSKSDTVTIGLRERGYSILGFNMSGHDPASNIPGEQTTLGDNVKESKAFYSYLDPQRKKKIIAYSLGATPALKILGMHLDEVDRIVLFGPAIYSAQAYDKPFGEEFRRTISKPFSYRENDVIVNLEAFQGKLLLIKGEYDGLDPVVYGKPQGTSAGKVEIDNKGYYSPIPKEVMEMIYYAVPPERREMVVVPGSDHGIVPWIVNHPAEGVLIVDKIAAFLKS
ncbi:MAG: alpha/beta hydrolase [Candidatus Levybacteria bacterium]|nr:alpha/beta hydrolase [Candidatus Levybacteria bacterium]